MNWITSKAKSWRRNARVLFADISYRRNLTVFAWVVGVFLLAFAVLWWLGVGIQAEVYRQEGENHALTFHEYLFSVLGAIDADPKTVREICEKLNILEAKSVIVLGDACDPVRGDLKNLAFAAAAGGYVRRKRLKEFKRSTRHLGEGARRWLRHNSDEVPMPFYVQMDDVPTFDLMKRMEYKIGSRRNRKEVCLAAVGSYLRPFSYYEGWARMIWGAPYATAPHYYPLDFRPMDADAYVHLVVAGLSKAGEALVIEALRICHYPNGGPTRITIVDANPHVEEDFRTHHREVFELHDVEISFKIARLQSQEVQDFIASEARNQDCLLTVAVCFRNIEATMLEALCLPHDVFYGFDGQEGVVESDRIEKRLEYPRHPPRVLVYQEHVNGRPEQGDSALPVRYRWLRPFGMQEDGVQTRCMRSFASLYLNATFFWPIDADGKSLLDLFLESKFAGLYVDAKEEAERFRERWKASIARNKPAEISVDERYRLLTLIISKDDSLLDAFKKHAFRRFVLMDPVKEWSNVYVPDSYGSILRSLGLEAKRVKAFDDSSANVFLELLRRNESRFDEARQNVSLSRSLEEVEHARWMADRALMGYRASRPEDGERRDDGYRYHNAMRPYSELSETERNKDALVIRFIPMFLALEGFAVEERELA